MNSMTQRYLACERVAGKGSVFGLQAFADGFG